MRAVTFNASDDTFIVRELAIPEPGFNELLVRVDAAGLNPVDSKIIYWKSMLKEMSPDWVPGLDVSGYVAGVGAGVKSFKEGDRVLYHGDMFKEHGGFAEYAVQCADTVIRHPEIDSVTAAAT